jgi:hypothetical protein
MQRLVGNRAVVNLLEGRSLVQTKLRTSEPGDQLEQEADLASLQMLSSAPVGLIQRKCGTCSPTSKCASCEEEETLQRKPGIVSSTTAPHIQRAAKDGDSASHVGPGAAEPEAAATGPLIVEDDAATMAPGQRRKSEFLEQLRSAVCTTADEALAAAGQSTEGCPYIEQWLSYYENQEPAHIERALRKYAPEAAAATSARDYIPAVSNRVRRGVETWAKTGEITGVPDELKDMLTGPGAALGAIGGMLGSIGSAIGGAVTAVAGAIGGAFSAIGKALFKRKEGHGEEATDGPEEIQAKLSGGQPLDGGASSRMGAAFGHDFSDVRVHTDTNAAGLSDSLNARAFTIGSDIAFGAGEYQPGTLIGDALIAHELAHVVQQSGGAAAGAPLSKGDIGHDELEEDADVAAVGAVVSVWGGVKGSLTDIGKSAMPRMRSGLRLQGCSDEKEKKKKKRSPEFIKLREQFVKEGLDKLNGSGCRFPGGVWRYDETYWEHADEGLHVYMPKGITPAEAIDKLFERLSLWDFDCAMYPEVALLYANRKALGDDAFNEEFKDLRLRQHSSTGLEHELYDIEVTPEDEFNKQWDAAPVGSKVAWSNRSAVTIGTAWRNENALKRTKGDKPADARYDAFPLGTNMTEEEVKIGLASNAGDWPSTPAAQDAYVAKNIYRHQVQIF